MMEVEDQDYADTGGSGVMVSNLPLLFSGGTPSSLYQMDQSELEVFVPFMVRCSVGEERPVPWSHLPRPPWWPKKLPFRMPPSRTALTGLVERCYSFHGCDYLLQFCASLVAQMPPTGYRFNDNRDGTTSMYHGSTGKLLVTFRNENRDYDKYRHGGKGRDATKKLLLSPSSHSGGSGGVGSSASTAMIQPPVTDIYLCDKCENEFYSLKEVQAHERHCCGEVPSSPPTPSPEPDVTEEEPEPTGQVPFLSYFNLHPAQHTGLEPHTSPRKKSVSGPPAKLPGPIYPRYDSIPLTSPLGQYLFAHSKSRNKYQPGQHSVMRYERHLPATPNADINYRERCTSRWIVVWRNRKDRQQWIHLYSFNRAERRERNTTIQTGLSRESRRLLRLCRPVVVEVKRLPKRMVDRLLRMGGPTSAPCIDLTDDHHHLDPDHFGLGALEPLDPLDPLGPLDPLDPLGPQLDYWVNPRKPSAQSTIQLQWMSGLPPQNSSLCLPGSSGSLAPQYSGQVGLHSLVGLSVGHNSFIPLVPGHSQQQQQQVVPPGLTLQPSSVSSRPVLPLISNNFKATQNLPVQDGNGRLHFPLSADITISPIRASEPTHRELEADLMKPLSRKKFPGHLGSSITRVNRQQARAPVTFPPSRALHHIPPPQPPDWERVVPLAGGEDNTLHHTLTSSSIEVIDLSSDEDEYVRVGRGRSEAANAPPQLDGLACYPHTGAKVPSESSEYSKNGNSHWSSRQKSHCGAGRVGDSAINGQPTNVLPSPSPSPPLTTTPAPCTQGPHTKGNSRKRKNQEDLSPPHGGKTIILDISSKGVIVSEDLCPFTPTASPTTSLTLTPTASASSDFGYRRREYCGATEEAVVPVASLPGHSAMMAHTKVASESTNSLKIDGDVSFKTPLQIDEHVSFNTSQVGPQECGRLCPEEALTGPVLDGGSSVKFLTSLVTKGLELFKSLMSKASEGAVVSPGEPVGLESFHAVQCGAASAKRTNEVQKLLRDECRELRRSGLKELSHLDLQGTRLTRRAVGHIMPAHPARKTLGPRFSENRPPHKHGTKPRREDGRGGRREEVACVPLGIKGPAPLTIDENGNSAAYVQAGPKQLDTRDGLHPLSRVQHGRGGVAGPESPREWKVALTTLPSTLEHSDCNFNSGDHVDKSTVFSEISIQSCGVLENNVSGVWGNSVTNTLEYTKCSTGFKTKGTPTESEVEKELFPGGALVPGRVNGHGRSEERHVCGPKGKAALGAKVRLGTPWAAGTTGASVGGIKKVTNLPGPGKDVSSLGHTSALARPELTGETAEECGAQLALCPLPDQLQHHPGGSDTTPPSTPSPRPHLTLLNSIRKEHSPPGKHPTHSTTLEQDPQPHLCPPTKPHSTNRRKKSRRCRELINLGRDEWKEMQGTGYHPSDLVGCKDVKYLSVSSDEDEAHSHSALTPAPTSTPAPGPQAKESGTKSRKPVLSSKVSREVARLLGDECKELRPPRGRPPKSHRDKDKDKWRSMHPLASLTHSTHGLLGEDRAPGQGGGRCSTRSHANTQPLVEVFTHRDTHRHLLRSEVAMCVLNYELPNIH